ncbi:MAG: MinD/ParA family protein [Ruminococcaceae bacterium]|nr:MinD/ParA family protein [Oscillospiraceae bacterium]
MENKRITLFAGHYGSGKTNIAVNYALHLKEKYEKVVITDLDIVNPYFRTADSLNELTKAGIKLISSEFANSNVDLPALPQEVYSILDDRSAVAILDIGGDDRGAYALGRYEASIKEENDYEMLFVFNKYRPLTPDAKSAFEVMREIEAAGKIKFTAIVNNSNLGPLTTKEDVLDSLESANELASLSGLPVKMTTVDENLFNILNGEIENVFPLKLQKKIV